MNNLPMPRPRWVIATTARNEIECQRIRQRLERKGISVRVQSVIVANSREAGAQLKVFVPSSDLRRAQTIIKENHSKTYLVGGRHWFQVRDISRLPLVAVIIVALLLGSLLLRIW